MTKERSFFENRNLLGVFNRKSFYADIHCLIQKAELDKKTKQQKKGRTRKYNKKRQREMLATWRYRQKNRICEICRIRKAEHTHHLIPFSQGGKDKESNFIAVCKICHKYLHYRNNRKALKRLRQEMKEKK